MTFALLSIGLTLLAFLTGRASKAVPPPGAPHVTPLPSPNPTAVSFLVGDSHMQGLAPHLGTALHPSVVRAFPGWSSASFLAEGTFDGPLGNFVLIAIGTNDYWLRPEVSAANVRGILQAVRRRNPAAVIAWIGPPRTPRADMAKPLEVVSDQIRTILADTPATVFLDSRDIALPFGPDHVHPTAEGYAQWARWICTVLRKELGALRDILVRLEGT